MSYPALTNAVTTSTVLADETGAVIEIEPGVLLLLDQQTSAGVPPYTMDGQYLRAGWLRNVMENDWLNETLIEGEYIAASTVPVARLKPSLRYWDEAQGTWKLKPSISTDGTFAGLKHSIIKWTP